MRFGPLSRRHISRPTCRCIRQLAWLWHRSTNSGVVCLRMIRRCHRKRVRRACLCQWHATLGKLNVVTRALLFRQRFESLCDDATASTITSTIYRW